MARVRGSRGAQPSNFPGFSDVTEIGAGGLSTVYRAREDGTNRLVALKLLNVGDVSARSIESFERESVLLGALSAHPNIVTLYRFFRAADGRPVLVLELCRGSIGDQTDGRGLPVAQAVAVGIKIAAALETAHRAQILHRDVKPQSILITDYGEPALADFGVALLHSATQTTAGLFDFTTLHVAPELLEGGATSPATDVYELASTLYQLIAGRAAFRAYPGESPASVILRILRDPVHPLTDPRVPVGLSDLLVAAMSKNPAFRPRTAAEFAAQLAGVQQRAGWSATPFLIRDPSGRQVGLPIGTDRPSPPPPPPSPPPQWAPPRAWSAPPSGWRPPPAQPPPPPPEWQPLQRPAHQPPPTQRAQQPTPPTYELPPSAGKTPTSTAMQSTSSAGVSRAAAPGIDAALRAFDIPARPTTEEVVTTRPDEASLPPVTAPPPPVTPPPVTPPPTQYPIPPVAAEPAPAPGATTPPVLEPVPTWGLRAAAGDPSAPRASGDLVLDPSSLRPRLTIRSGSSSMSVDDAGLTVRSWLRGQTIGWQAIDGFEPRLEPPETVGDAAAGRLVAITDTGPVELPATRRPVTDLRYLHALLDAYRRRGLSGRR